MSYIYTAESAKKYYEDGEYRRAVIEATGVIHHSVYSALGNDVQVIKRTDEELRPTKMTRRAISDVKDRGLITPADEKEALWLLEFYNDLKDDEMPSKEDAERAITIAERFDRIRKE